MLFLTLLKKNRVRYMVCSPSLQDSLTGTALQVTPADSQDVFMLLSTPRRAKLKDSPF